MGDKTAGHLRLAFSQIRELQGKFENLHNFVLKLSSIRENSLRGQSQPVDTQVDQAAREFPLGLFVSRQETDRGPEIHLFHRSPDQEFLSRLPALLDELATGKPIAPGVSDLSPSASPEVPQPSTIQNGSPVSHHSQSSSSSLDSFVDTSRFDEGGGASAPVAPCPLATAKDYARQMERLFSQADDTVVALEDLFEKIYARRSPLGEFVFLEAGRKMASLRGLRTELLEKLAELK